MQFLTDDTETKRKMLVPTSSSQRFRRSEMRIGAYAPRRYILKTFSGRDQHHWTERSFISAIGPTIAVIQAKSQRQNRTEVRRLQGLATRSPCCQAVRTSPFVYFKVLFFLKKWSDHLGHANVHGNLSAAPDLRSRSNLRCPLRSCLFRRTS